MEVTTTGSRFWGRNAAPIPSAVGGEAPCPAFPPPGGVEGEPYRLHPVEPMGRSLPGFRPAGGEEALIRAALAGETEAFQDLASRHAAGVFNLAMLILKNRSEAEEVLQDAMLTAFEKLAGFRGSSSFKTWLYRIARNCSLMRLRKRRREPDPLPEEWEKPADPRPWSENPEAAFGRAELRKVLDEAFGTLPEIYRTAFWLRDVQGMSNQEVADTLGLSLPAVKSRILRARLHLRDRLAPYFEERGRDDA